MKVKIMEPKEIIQRTLDFTNPDRVGHSFAPSDFAWDGPVIPVKDGEWRRTKDDAWERKDEWGNTWRRIDPTSKGEVAIGAIPDLDQVGSIPLPDFNRREYYNQVKETFANNPCLYHIGGIHGYTFSIARKLRRMDQYLMDLVLEPEKISLLHDRVDEQIRNQMDRLIEAGADCIMLAEDWGTQIDLLISPRLWRQEFKPRFQSLNDYAHSLGLNVFMHSCGKITRIIPDLIETGVDLLQFDQPQIHGIDTLASFQETAKITFWCPVDIQTTLQTRNEDAIRAEARQLIDKLWCRGGGFVAGFYSDEPSIGLDPKWQQIAMDEFMHAGKSQVI